MVRSELLSVKCAFPRRLNDNEYKLSPRSTPRKNRHWVSRVTHADVGRARIRCTHMWLHCSSGIGLPSSVPRPPILKPNIVFFGEGLAQAFFGPPRMSSS